WTTCSTAAPRNISCAADAARTRSPSRPKEKPAPEHPEPAFFAQELRAYCASSAASPAASIASARSSAASVSASSWSSVIWPASSIASTCSSTLSACCSPISSAAFSCEPSQAAKPRPSTAAEAMAMIFFMVFPLCKKGGPEPTRGKVMSIASNGFSMLLTQVCSSAIGAGSAQRQPSDRRDANDDPVPGERSEAVAAYVSDKDADHDQSHQERRNEARCDLAPADQS